MDKRLHKIKQQAFMSGACDSSTPIQPSLPLKHRSLFGEVADAAVNKVSKKTTVVMILEAVSTLADPKKGVSFQAIKKWILANNSEVNEDRISGLMKIAVKKALENGKLVRSKASKNCHGAVGSFALPRKQEIKNSKTNFIKKRLPEMHASDPEITLNKPRTKKKRLNVSDTEMEISRRMVGKAKPEVSGKVKPKSTKASKKDSVPLTERMPKNLKAVVSDKVKAKSTKASTKDSANMKGMTVEKLKKDSLEKARSTKISTKNPVTVKGTISGKLEAEESEKGKKPIKVPKKNPVAPKGKALDARLDSDANKNKTASREVNNMKKASKKEAIPKRKITKIKLYSETFRKAEVKNRKDISDSEVDVKRNLGQSLRSYHSDTEA
ncbi:uncharacterized protein LOC118200728 [Stegodyphus dumicola]|uniref:uncharacterized protein LOC118200728 n=1 Tax=Stegodyphus dumicola TaxID=202533 RepID=UPI0015B08265|nr:uncharacterized protein LOC118200728 [Stegodyphus dumicola]